MSRSSSKVTTAIVRFVGEFPLTVTGKVQKFVMRDVMNKEMTAEAAG